MKLTRYDKPLTAPPETAGPGRPVDPNSCNAMAKKHGINRGTLRNRLRAGMTMQEAIEAPIKTRFECGQMAAKARWGGTK